MTATTTGPLSRVCVLGAGGLGALLAGRMAQAGIEAVLIGRPAQVEAIQRDGLRIVVQKFIEDGARADLKKWMQMVEVTASRAGLLLCADMEIAKKIIAARPAAPFDNPTLTSDGIDLVLVSGEIAYRDGQPTGARAGQARTRLVLHPGESIRSLRILQLRYGLLDGQAYTLEEVGQIFNITRERVRQIEAQALSRLRHPTHARKLRDYLRE